MKSSYVPSSALGTTIEPSEMTLGTGVGTGILSRPVFATTATAGDSTLTLTVTSAATQEFTGSTYHLVVMPSVDTLVAGWATLFINKSTDRITIRASDGSSIITFLYAGQSVSLVCNDIAGGTGAAAWDVVGPSATASLLATLASDQSLTDAVAEALIFQGATGTLAASLNGTTGVFTAPVAGRFRFNGVVAYSCTDTGEPNVFTYVDALKNGTSGGAGGGTSVGQIIATTTQMSVSSSLTNAGGLPFDFNLSLTAGDFIRLDLTMSDNGNSGVFAALNSSTSLQIPQLPV